MKWIACSERMPDGATVLVISFGQLLLVRHEQGAFYTEPGKWWKLEEEDVSHWMPLPPFPEGSP